MPMSMIANRKFLCICLQKNINFFVVFVSLKQYLKKKQTCNDDRPYAARILDRYYNIGYNTNTPSFRSVYVRSAGEEGKNSVHRLLRFTYGCVSCSEGWSKF